MAKGQKHSNREVRKPKKNKDTAKDPASALKGMSVSSSITKKKG